MNASTFPKAALLPTRLCCKAFPSKRIVFFPKNLQCLSVFAANVNRNQDLRDIRSGIGPDMEPVGVGRTAREARPNGPDQRQAERRENHNFGASVPKPGPAFVGTPEPRAHPSKSIPPVRFRGDR